MRYAVSGQWNKKPTRSTETSSEEDATSFAADLLGEMQFDRVADEDAYAAGGAAYLAATELIAAARDDPGVPKVMHIKKSAWREDKHSFVRCVHTDDNDG
jgi:hypothetical protein